MVRNLIVFFMAAALIQLAFGDSCPYAYGNDGSFYDLSKIAWGVHQYQQVDKTYTYNISLCSAIPSGCSGSCLSPYSSGVCQFWGPAPANARCLGSVGTRKVIGLDAGAGVQITYEGGDVCGTCTPYAPRTSVITLSCDPRTPPGKIIWTGLSGAEPGQPAILYFSGTMYCDKKEILPTCQNLYAPDGSNYDLTEYMGSDFSAQAYDPNSQVYVNYLFSICGGISDTCGTGVCSGYRSGAVCQNIQGSSTETCYGKFDGYTRVQALNFGQGVNIYYYDGDSCSSCGSDGLSAVLQLTCDNFVPSDFYVTGVSTAAENSVVYINATIGCLRFTPQPSWGPQSYSPNSYTPSYSPKSYAPSYSPKSYTPSYSPKSYTPSYSPRSYTPSYSPRSYTPSYSPKSYTPSYSPRSYTPSYSPKSYTPSYSPRSYTPSYSPKSYTPSYSPKSYSPSSDAPSSPYNPYRHVTIQYFGYEPSCNGSDAFMVTVERTANCYPGCSYNGKNYVMTTCDDDVYLPRGASYVESINYGNSYFCDVAQSVVYVRSHKCTGNFDFSYQECDANSVYTYSCNSPYCNQCQLTGKVQTEYCDYGTMYRCVADNKGLARRNPLL